MQADVWVDFNDANTAGELTTLARFAGPDVLLAPGAEVVAVDDDGTRCDAVVVSVDERGLVRLQLRWETLRHAD